MPRLPLAFLTKENEIGLMGEDGHGYVYAQLDVAITLKDWLNALAYATTPVHAARYMVEEHGGHILSKTTHIEKVVLMNINRLSSEEIQA